MRDKIILTDSDGVLVDWLTGFSSFMDSKGFDIMEHFESSYWMHARYGIDEEQARQLIREYNEGPLISTLTPFGDSVKYVGMLANLGFKFIVITSLSSNPEAKKYRTINLNNLFGDIFTEIHCLDMGKSKYNELGQWKDSGLFWIEDHIGNAEAGLAQGLKSVLVSHDHNSSYNSEHIPVVGPDAPWEQIYEMICKDYSL